MVLLCFQSNYQTEHIISTNKWGMKFLRINRSKNYHTVLHPVLQLLTFWEKSFVILANYHADWCSCMFSISIFKHFLFYYFNKFLLLVLLAAIDYLWLFLWKRCFVRCENQSLFDCKLKSIEEINGCHKKETSQNPWSTWTWGSIYEFSYFLNFWLHIQSVTQ